MKSIMIAMFPSGQRMSPVLRFSDLSSSLMKELLSGFVGRSPSNMGDTGSRSWEYMSGSDMPRSFAMSTSLCAETITFDVMDTEAVSAGEPGLDPVRSW